MRMQLPSHQLQAFFETVQAGGFSRAAKKLGITQSALSQRISGLEGQLEATLLIRDPAGPRLTEAGEQLLRYCQAQGSLEQEVLAQLKKAGTEQRGVVRIGAFSSVLRSVLIPSLAKFLRANPEVRCEFRSYEVVDLPDALRNAEVDFVVLDHHLERTGLCEHVLGQEEYVVIESARHESPEGLYLDHGPHDNATESFFRSQPGAPARYRRSFMGDVYGILDAVELGLGRAVMSKHLLKDGAKVRVVEGYRRYRRPITLNYYEQAYYPELHRKVVEVLRENCAAYL